jgi:hypothetical protein
MLHLPSEQAANLAVALGKFRAGEWLEIRQPCDCGSHIRHNNGGNYHQIITLAHDIDGIYIKYDSTCELLPEAEWQKISEDGAEQVITAHADWL